jgi:hypothetical protein
MIKEHACPEFTIMKKFFMKEWKSAEEFYLWKLLSQWETAFLLKNETHVKLLLNNCHYRETTILLEKKHVIHSLEITVSR